MKYIIVHGIGNSQSGWAKDLYIPLGCQMGDIIEFNWEDNIERTMLDRLIRWALYKTPLSKALFDYGADVPRYFFDKRLRASIVDELVLKMYLLNEPFYLIGFSQGSVIALEALASAEDTDHICAGLITLGSPIGHGIVKRLVKHPKLLKRCWYNLWSHRDFISSRIVVKYNQTINFAVDVGHNIEAYMAELRTVLQRDAT